MLDMKNDIEDNLTKRPVLISYHENRKWPIENLYQLISFMLTLDFARDSKSLNYMSYATLKYRSKRNLVF